MPLAAVCTPRKPFSTLFEQSRFVHQSRRVKLTIEIRARVSPVAMLGQRAPLGRSDSWRTYMRLDILHQLLAVYEERLGKLLPNDQPRRVITVLSLCREGSLHKMASWSAPDSANRLPVSYESYARPTSLSPPPR